MGSGALAALPAHDSGYGADGESNAAEYGQVGDHALRIVDEERHDEGGANDEGNGDREV